MQKTRGEEFFQVERIFFGSRKTTFFVRRIGFSVSESGRYGGHGENGD